MIIGLTGYIGSGKTTIADYIEFRYGFPQYSFAGPIKEIAEILGFTQEQLNGSQEDKLAINQHWNISAREFLQKFGTEVCREFLPRVIPEMSDIWIKLFKIRAQQEKNILISDVRFPDEAKAIHELGGVIIRITRQKNNSHMPHKSETYIDQIPADYEINNTGSLQNLFNLVDSIITQIPEIQSPDAVDNQEESDH